MMQKFVGVAAAVVVLVVGAWFFAVWKPLNHRLGAAEITQAQTESRVAGLRAQVVAFVAEERHAPAERAALRKLDEAVPRSPELSTALRDLASAAASSGAGLSSISPSAPAVGPSGTSGTTVGPTPLTLSLAATGSYRQLTGFVRDIESLPRLFVVSSIALNGGGGASTGGSASAAAMSLSLNVEMFYASTNG